MCALRFRCVPVVGMETKRRRHYDGVGGVGALLKFRTIVAPVMETMYAGIAQHHISYAPTQQRWDSNKI